MLNWKRQLLLAAVLFALGTFAFWFEYKQKPKNDEAAEQAKKIFSLKNTSVESVKIFNGPKSVEIRCLDLSAKQCQPGDNSKWEMTSPMKTRADDPNTNGLVSALAQLDAVDTIDLKDETPEKRAALLREYGLDPESRGAPATRKIEVKTSAKRTLILGQTHPIGEGFFSLIETDGKIDENKVYVVPNYFKSNIDHDISYWRDKKLVTLSAHEVGSLTLKDAKVELTAVRKDGAWTLTLLSGKDKGETFPADSEAIDSILNGATFMTAKDFASDKKDDAKAKSVLKTAKQIATLTLEKSAPPSPKPGEGKGESVTLTLYQKSLSASSDPKKPATVTPKIYASVSNLDPLYELEPYARDRIEKGLNDLRLAKLLSSMERYQVRKLEFSAPTVSIRLDSKDGKWMNTLDQTEADSNKVGVLLDRLTGTKVKDFLPMAAAPPGEAAGLRVTASGDDKTPLKREFVFWKALGNLYARDLTSPRKEVFQMDTGLTEALPWDNGFFTKSASPTPAAAPPGGTPAAAPKAAH